MSDVANLVVPPYCEILEDSEISNCVCGGTRVLIIDIQYPSEDNDFLCATCERITGSRTAYEETLNKGD